MAGATEVPDGGLPFVAKVSFGDSRACTGALVDSRWIVTAKACFFDGTTAVTAGPPSQSTTVVLGHADVTTATGNRLVVTSLVPNPDRDIVLAQLSAPVRDIAPVAIDTTAPQPGETLQIAGYGRTATEWVPNRMHADAFTVGTVSSGGFTVDGSSAGATLCKGDSGGPAFRDTGSGPQLVGISSTSGQKGCLSEPDGTSEGSEARTDDLADWIRSNTTVAPDQLLQPVTGEFTRDGKQDMVATDSAGLLWLYPGTAIAGVWGHRVLIGSGWGGFRDLAVGRINRDQYDDLIGIQSSTGILYEYPGTAAGTKFGAKVQVGTGWGSDLRDLAVGKVDRDDFDDILVVSDSTKHLLLYKGTAAGNGFSNPVDDGSGWNCCSRLALGKFTNDDYDDLVTVDTTGKLRMYPGTAAGTSWPTTVDTPTGTGWGATSAIVAGQFDGTGLDGLLSVDATTGLSTLHPRTAAGGWAGPVQPTGTPYTPQPYDMTNIVTGEFTRDAYADLVGTDATGQLWLFPGTAANTFGRGVLIGSGWGGFRDLMVGRINRDDYDDLIAIQSSTSILYEYPGTAAGTKFGTKVQVGSGWGTDLHDLTIGQVDRDAYDDVLANSTSGKQLLLYKGTTAGNGFSGPFTNAAGFDCCTQLTMGKFDNDDYPDLLAVDNTGKLRLYAGTAAGTTWAASADAGPGGDWRDHSELSQITMSPSGHSGLLAKDGTGAMLYYPSGDNGSVDWTHPTAFGPRD